MSYQDKLDRRASIREAKREMKHFSDLLLLNRSGFDMLKAPSFESLGSVVSYINYDAKLLNEIDKKDEQLKDIQIVLEAISKLKEEEMQLVYAKYILMYSDKKIEELLSLSSSKRNRDINNALFNLSIALKIEVPK